jgi:hypothetical protein
VFARSFSDIMSSWIQRLLLPLDIYQVPEAVRAGYGYGAFTTFVGHPVMSGCPQTRTHPVTYRSECKPYRDHPGFHRRPESLNKPSFSFSTFRRSRSIIFSRSLPKESLGICICYRTPKKRGWHAWNPRFVFRYSSRPQSSFTSDGRRRVKPLRAGMCGDSGWSLVSDDIVSHGGWYALNNVDMTTYSKVLKHSR